MREKIKKRLLAFLTVLGMALMLCPATAFAYVDPSAEAETQGEVVVEEPVTEPAPETSPEITPESTPETSGDTSFSIPGNGEVLDDITDDGSKEFFTITSANGNTYFLVIDKSNNSENVYMLSMIDENDLQDFIDEEGSEKAEDSQGTVVLEEPEETVTPEEPAESTEESEAKEETSSGSLTSVFAVILLAAVVGAGAYFYFKVYKPRQEEDEAESENMEISDGLETINEDEMDSEEDNPDTEFDDED